MIETDATEHNDLSVALKAKARALGFNLVGIIRARPGKRLDAYLAWIARGYADEMGYMARPDRVERRRDVYRLPG